MEIIGTIELDYEDIWIWVGNEKQTLSNLIANYDGKEVKITVSQIKNQPAEKESDPEASGNQDIEKPADGEKSDKD